MNITPNAIVVQNKARGEKMDENMKNAINTAIFDMQFEKAKTERKYIKHALYMWVPFMLMGIILFAVSMFYMAIPVDLTAPQRMIHYIIFFVIVYTLVLVLRNGATNFIAWKRERIYFLEDGICVTTARKTYIFKKWEEIKNFDVEQTEWEKTYDIGDLILQLKVGVAFKFKDYANVNLFLAECFANSDKFVEKEI